MLKKQRVAKIYGANILGQELENALIRNIVVRPQEAKPWIAKSMET